MQDWSEASSVETLVYKGGKIPSTTQDKSIMKPGPEDKVYTLVPHVPTEKILAAGEKAARQTSWQATNRFDSEL